MRCLLTESCLPCPPTLRPISSQCFQRYEEQYQAAKATYEKELADWKKTEGAGVQKLAKQLVNNINKAKRAVAGKGRKKKRTTKRKKAPSLANKIVVNGKVVSKKRAAAAKKKKATAAKQRTTAKAGGAKKPAAKKPAAKKPAAKKPAAAKKVG